MERSGMGLQLLGFKLTASYRTLVVLLGWQLPRPPSLYFLQEIERCADASIDRAAFFFASNISYAFTLHLSKEMDASRFFGARKMFCWREKFNAEKFIVEDFERRSNSSLKKFIVEENSSSKKVSS